jgi:hypothetical protein
VGKIVFNTAWGNCSSALLSSRKMHDRAIEKRTGIILRCTNRLPFMNI